jgi:nucleotide-binding universal stress UspA family protein
MAAFQNILVSVDLEEASDRVLDVALGLASKLGARLSVLHVYSLPVYNLPDGSYVPTAEVANSVAEAARRQLDATVARYGDRGVTVSGILRNGSPQVEISNVANEIGADLIVMGTHGRGALGRVLLGSVAQTVVRSATQPVLTIRNAPET